MKVVIENAPSGHCEQSRALHTKLAKPSLRGGGGGAPLVGCAALAMKRLLSIAFRFSTLLALLGMGAMGAAQAQSAPGAFDFYLLTLSWSPGFCDTGGAAKAPDQCAIGSGQGFVVHGLWPQYQHGYPSDCDASPRWVSSAALALTHGVFPDEGLARYEYRKHGSCSGLAPQEFFAAVRQARDAIIVPENLKAPHAQLTLAPNEIVDAFIAANNNLHADNIAVGCSHGELEDVRICISKDLSAYASCAEVARRSCHSRSINVPPLH